MNKFKLMVFALFSLAIAVATIACGSGGNNDGAPPTVSPFTLTMQKNGSGTVTSSPSGINCGTDCEEAFAVGTKVTLTAVATGSFSSWSGCDSTSGTSCVVTMDQAKTITANFIVTPNGPNLTGSPSATEGTPFSLTWTYLFGGLASTQEGYKLEESTNTSFSNSATIFNSINNNDAVSPKTYMITKNTAGTYYYRVQAYDAPAGLTDWSNTLTVVVQQPTVTVKTYYSTVDASTIWSDASTEFENTNYGSSTVEYGVGNYYQYGLYVSNLMTEDIFVYFNTGSDLSGKTIVSATLRLTPRALATDKTGLYRVHPVAGYWDEGTITYKNGPNYYTAPYVDANPPQTYTDTSWDVTSMVQAWASGTRTNNGFFIEDLNAQSLYYTWNQITYYHSGEAATQSYRPKLVVQFQ